MDGHTALVTGGSRGIGRAIAERLQAEGYQVLSPSRGELDLNDLESVHRFLHSAPDEIDVLINNAAVNPIAALESLHLDRWDETLRVNLTSPMLLIRHFAPLMARRNWGRIVNIISNYTFVARVGRASYSASKSGLLALTRTAALEYAEKGVLTNAVSPGFVDTELTSANNSPAQIERIISTIPIRRLAQPGEIAETVAFLVSERNSYITGQVIVADGGFLCQ